MASFYPSGMLGVGYRADGLLHVRHGRERHRV